MPTFVSLLTWTEQGIKNFRDTTARAEAFRGLVEKHGGRLVSCYWTLGDYDIVATIDTPDPETYMAVALELGSLGNVRSTSLRAFDQGEIEAIIAETS